MTQQGQRQARWRQWAGSANTYNGDLIGAGQAASGLTGLTYNEALMYCLRAITGSTDTNLANLEAQAAQFLQVPGGWDSVGSEIPVAAWDFTSGGTFPGLTYGALFEGAVSRDSLIYRGQGEARSSSLGLLGEEQTVNKCTNTNMKMVDTSGTTPDGAWGTHEAVALGSLPAEVFDALPPFTPGKLTATYHSVSNAAGQIVIDGVTGTTNEHYGGGWVYVVSGDFGFAIGAGSDTTATQGEWIRIGDNDLTPLATDQLRAITTQASEAYWFGDQLEENPARTSLIEVNGSATTRLSDLVAADMPSGFDIGAFIAVVEYQSFMNGNSTFQYSMQLDSGTETVGTVGRVRRRTDNNIQQLTDEQAPSFSGPAYVADSITRIAWGYDGTARRWSVNGTYVGEDVIVPPADFTVVRFASVLAASTGQVNGYTRNLAIYDEVPTQAALDRLSA